MDGRKITKFVVVEKHGPRWAGELDMLGKKTINKTGDCRRTGVSRTRTKPGGLIGTTAEAARDIELQLSLLHSSSALSLPHSTVCAPPAQVPLLAMLPPLPSPLPASAIARPRARATPGTRAHSATPPSWRRTSELDWLSVSKQPVHRPPWTGTKSLRGRVFQTDEPDFAALTQPSDHIRLPVEVGLNIDQIQYAMPWATKSISSGGEAYKNLLISAFPKPSA